VERVRLADTTPGLRTLDRFRKLYHLAETGQTDDRGVPRPLQGAVIAVAYRNEIRLTSPPLPVQAVALALLAPIGRSLGFRST
jgi:hypothetical protein